MQPPHVHEEDVNADGLPDLLLQFRNQEIGLAAGMTTLCLTGTLPDARTFRACDAIRLVP